MADWVLEQELSPGRRDDVLDELQAARRDGARIVVASGTYTPIASRFAARLGAEAIGTDLAYDADGRATGGFAGALGTGDEKVARLTTVVAGATIETAYGDTAATSRCSPWPRPPWRSTRTPRWNERHESAAGGSWEPPSDAG